MSLTMNEVLQPVPLLPIEYAGRLPNPAPAAPIGLRADSLEPQG